MSRETTFDRDLHAVRDRTELMRIFTELRPKGWRPRHSPGAAQLLQRLPVIGGAAHSPMQAETVDIDAQRLLEVLLPGHGALQRQHLLAGERTEGDATSTRRTTGKVSTRRGSPDDCEPPTPQGGSPF